MTTPVPPFTVRVSGEIDLDSAPDLRRELSRALADHRQVVLDLSQVTFMDCSGLNVLMEARNQADRNGARLALRGITRPVARLLELTGLTAWPAPAPRPPGRTAQPRHPPPTGGRTPR
ncbi:STAS domain-containing protein [Kitasatospora sp. NPDC098652]|uniref:STAS domain-containing protein n=1 Tax=Kitasatospora sp. NPDC098652 TaxID=3364095 RepID=UPI0038044A0C